jgi:phosphate transport system substrate-binding protein
VVIGQNGHLIFVLRSPHVSLAFTFNRYGLLRASDAPWARATRCPAETDRKRTEVRAPVDSGSTVQVATASPRKTKRSFAVALVAGGILLAACSSSATPATTTVPPGGKLTGNNAKYIAADLKAPAGTLQAAGSTFVQPFFTKAFFTYTSQNPGLQVNYSSVGSGDGISDFQAGTVDFAASDVPMSASDLAKVPASSGPVIQIPDTLGGVTVSYNLPGITKRLKLDAATVAGMFDGSIKTWNDPQIAALNPGVTLPSHSITPEVRADSSGTTYIFSDFLNTAAPTEWTLGASKTISWPSVAVQTPHNSGVAASVQSTPYSVGYVELAYAIENKFTYAAIKNAAGAYVVPSAATVAADADQKTGITPTNFSVVNAPGATSYPISGYSWAILLQKQKSATTGAQVVKVLDWTSHTGGGQDLAAGLDYVILPPAVQNQDRTELLTVTGPSGQVLLTK